MTQTVLAWTLGQAGHTMPGDEVLQKSVIKQLREKKIQSSLGKGFQIKIQSNQIMLYPYKVVSDCLKPRGKLQLHSDLNEMFFLTIERQMLLLLYHLFLAPNH
jgi:hypothetical protein